jgi:hypothetical protein
MLVGRGIRITCLRQCIPGAVLLRARPGADGTLGPQMRPLYFQSEMRITKAHAIFVHRMVTVGRISEVHQT